jgi:hypothetical protein
MNSTTERAERLIRSLPWGSFDKNVRAAIGVLRSMPADDETELTEKDFAAFENASDVLRDKITIAMYRWKPEGLIN